MLLSAAGGGYWPLATYRCPSLEPCPSAGSGAHRPLTTLCPRSPSLAYPYLPTHPSFPLGGGANGAPGLPLFHCSVSGPHRGGQRPSSLARCVPVGTPDRRWGRRGSLAATTHPTQPGGGIKKGGGGGVWDPKFWVPKLARSDFPHCKSRFSHNGHLGLGGGGGSRGG